MNVDTCKMSEYAEFLDETSRRIVSLCNAIEKGLFMAVQCMDQQSSRAAVQRMAENLENVKNNVPVSDDASKRLVLSKTYIDGAKRVFGG